MSGHVWSAKFDPRIAWHRSRFAVCKAKSSEAPVSSFWWLAFHILTGSRFWTIRLIDWWKMIPTHIPPRMTQAQHLSRFFRVTGSVAGLFLGNLHGAAEQSNRRSLSGRWAAGGDHGGCATLDFYLKWTLGCKVGFICHFYNFHFEMVERPPYGNIGDLGIVYYWVVIHWVTIVVDLIQLGKIWGIIVCHYGILQVHLSIYFTVDKIIKSYSLFVVQVTTHKSNHSIAWILDCKLLFQAIYDDSRSIPRHRKKRNPWFSLWSKMAIWDLDLEFNNLFRDWCFMMFHFPKCYRLQRDDEISWNSKVCQSYLVILRSYFSNGESFHRFCYVYQRSLVLGISATWRPRYPRAIPSGLWANSWLCSSGGFRDVLSSPIYTAWLMDRCFSVDLQV
jgi:hypothetical protein